MKLKILLSALILLIPTITTVNAEQGDGVNVAVEVGGFITSDFRANSLMRDAIMSAGVEISKRFRYFTAGTSIVTYIDRVVANDDVWVGFHPSLVVYKLFLQKELGRGFTLVFEHACSHAIEKALDGDTYNLIRIRYNLM